MAGEAPPFYMGFRLNQIELDCGEISRDYYDRAPGGAFGKVLFGRWRGLRVAVKILASRQGVRASDAENAFRREVENLIAVRGAIDRARVLRRVGAPLTEPCNLLDPARRCTRPHSLAGFLNAVIVYGVGTERDLSALASGLPAGPAHLIVMEELTGGTLDFTHAVQPSIDTLEKLAAGTASGLALLAAAHVVHADLKVRLMGGKGGGGFPEDCLLSESVSYCHDSCFVNTSGGEHHAPSTRRRGCADRLRHGPHR